ncbi:MAG: hypothetical protein ACRC9P_07770, partial [Bacteroides sp.]
INFEDQPVSESGKSTTYNIMLPLRNYQNDLKIMSFQCLDRGKKAFKRRVLSTTTYPSSEQDEKIYYKPSNDAHKQQDYAITYWIGRTVAYSNAIDNSYTNPLMVRCTRQINNN